MAQKKAFVRYAQNKAVPGSLIVRTKAPKVGTWKEVPYDICCGGGGECTTPVVLTVLANFPVVQAPGLACGENGILYTGSVCAFPVGDFTWEDLIEQLNSPCASWLGFWELIPGEIDTIKLTMPCDLAKALCPNGTLSLGYPAIP